MDPEGTVGLASNNPRRSHSLRIHCGRVVEASWIRLGRTFIFISLDAWPSRKLPQMTRHMDPDEEQSDDQAPDPWAITIKHITLKGSDRPSTARGVNTKTTGDPTSSSRPGITTSHSLSSNSLVFMHLRNCILDEEPIGR